MVASPSPPPSGLSPEAPDPTAFRTPWSLTRPGRFVWMMQWWAPVILPFWVLLGRGFVGAGLGFVGIFGFVAIGVPSLIVLYIPALITLGDNDVRIARKTRFAYSIGACLLWGILLVTGLFVPDSSDGGPMPSAVMTWTSGGIAIDQSLIIMTVGIGVAAAADVAVIGLAVAGCSRRQLLTLEDSSQSEIRRGAVLTGFWIWWAAIAVELVSIVHLIVYAAEDSWDPGYFDDGWLVLEVIVVLAAPFFVLRLRSRSRVARAVLAVLAAGVLIGVMVLTTTEGFPSPLDSFVAILLVVGTVPLFVPSSNRYFS